MSVAKPLSLSVRIDPVRLKTPFRITGHVMDKVDLVVCTLARAGHQGRGEATGVYYHAETGASMLAQIEAVRGRIEAGITREALQTLLPAGGARNAVDCALWDLECAESGEAAWKRAGLPAPSNLLTTFTLGADSPEVMGARAAGLTYAKALKLKLIGDGLDAERVRAVRAAAPDVWIGVDANQAFDRAGTEALMPVLVEEKVSLLEQPCAIGADDSLIGLNSPIPLAADESAQTSADIARLAPIYDIINIKLDKSGGLTEGLKMAHLAREHGMGVMVGNMVGTSLSCGPAAIVGQLCDVVDLDGPWHLSADRDPAAVYENGYLLCPPRGWGLPERKAA
ncbi:mandelate racemase/muconate lactonizing enzyme [Glycocaulis alkaliphilus]|uniref:Dipeptide epimerase n=1 Tax=Glycocaulis alkaliphilus TaxID=1434191 RepID=A0A3T0E689_9PROT|nr:dipeptide epimerase [Glycocaulis alkaliphilus]AZU02819.1 mandelate racemase/muconate lactonizing enzyme [Glycocaulis alkaliphilus]GGB85060.1 dipeptide epimerase [Glycocaulis alkaliphilus]